MKSVKQSSEEALWFSRQLQDSPGEIVVFDRGEPAAVGEAGFGGRARLGIGISLFTPLEEGQREVENALNPGFSLCQTGPEKPCSKKISVRIQEGDSALDSSHKYKLTGVEHALDIRS